MKKPRTEHFRKLILERIEALRAVEEAGEEAEQAVASDQSRVGRLSRMDAMQQQAMGEEAQRRRAREVQRLEAALGRIDRGGFGTCLECGEAIGEARLEFDPSMTLCVRCAEARQHAENA